MYILLYILVPKKLDQLLDIFGALISKIETVLFYQLQFWRYGITALYANSTGRP